jgi:hypothetical protein
MRLAPDFTLVDLTVQTLRSSRLQAGFRFQNPNLPDSAKPYLLEQTSVGYDIIPHKRTLLPYWDYPVAFYKVN